MMGACEGSMKPSVCRLKVVQLDWIPLRLTGFDQQQGDHQ